ncbi:hypothetical protein B296_00025676 [Ensete ventricosum]|uniref:Uncharacterized protein n=1 Tax=Ensete ventricosum TaxID=4639 RepID=A0A426YBX7_ENSVE|nr:hypothetical protein B296_00025676 [Ensete ventricosum]
MTMNLKEGSRCAANRNEDLTAIDFDDDVSLAETEVIMLSTAMKILTSIDFEGDVNLKEGDCYVVNYDECLTVVDFGGSVILAEKRPLFEIVATTGFAVDEHVAEGWSPEDSTNSRGAAVAAATTRATARAVSRGVVGEEGELSVEKVAMVAGAGEEEIATTAARAAVRKASYWRLMGAEGEGRSCGRRGLQL